MTRCGIWGFVNCFDPSCKWSLLVSVAVKLSSNFCIKAHAAVAVPVSSDRMAWLWWSLRDGALGEIQARMERMDCWLLTPRMMPRNRAMTRG